MNLQPLTILFHLFILWNNNIVPFITCDTEIWEDGDRIESCPVRAMYTCGTTGAHLHRDVCIYFLHIYISLLTFNMRSYNE